MTNLKNGLDYNENIKMVINDMNDINVSKRGIKKSKKFMNDTFYITYVLLLTTATICFIEAIRTKDMKIRNILNLEVCISFVAAYFYSLFMEKINVSGGNENRVGDIDFAKINMTRYTDWSITTPLMLLVLLLALLYNTGGSLEISKFLVVLLLNFGMLASGFMGVKGNISKNAGLISGFVLFFALYCYIYMNFMYGKYHFDNVLIFSAFLVFWSLYGVLYMLGDEYEEEKNIGYNLLDLFSKCFVGIFFWAYFTKVFILK